MIYLDSVKVKSSQDCIQHLDRDSLLRERRWRGDSELGESFRTDKISGLNLGVKSIALDRAGCIVVEMSAKVLGRDYHRLISADTIGQAVESMNTSWLGISSDKFVENAQVLRCDVSNDLQVERPIRDYITRLYSYKVNGRYDTAIYSGESVIFKNKAKSFRERLIAYGKYADLKKDRKLAPLLGVAGVNAFRNTLRVEQNIASFKAIREKLGIEDTRLMSVLGSGAKPNYDLYSKIISVENPLLEIFTAYENMRILEIEKLEGVKGIIRLCGYDMRFVQELLKLKCGYDWSRRWGRYQSIYEMMCQSGEVPGVESIQGISGDILIQELGELLKCA